MFQNLPESRLCACPGISLCVFLSHSALFSLKLAQLSSLTWTKGTLDRPASSAILSASPAGLPVPLRCLAPPHSLSVPSSLVHDLKGGEVLGTEGGRLQRGAALLPRVLSRAGAQCPSGPVTWGGASPRHTPKSRPASASQRTSLPWVPKFRSTTEPWLLHIHVYTWDHCR